LDGVEWDDSLSSKEERDLEEQILQNLDEPDFNEDEDYYDYDDDQYHDDQDWDEP
jgi:hypothetical protein